MCHFVYCCDVHNAALFIVLKLAAESAESLPLGLWLCPPIGWCWSLLAGSPGSWSHAWSSSSLRADSTGEPSKWDKRQEMRSQVCDVKKKEEEEEETALKCKMQRGFPLSYVWLLHLEPADSACAFLSIGLSISLQRRLVQPRGWRLHLNERRRKISVCHLLNNMRPALNNIHPLFLH